MGTYFSLIGIPTWFLYGRQAFGKAGFEAAKRARWPDAASEAARDDLRGKIFIVTGANSGLGFVTAKALLERGGSVAMACRNETRALAARKRLLEETGQPEGRAEVHIVDMQSPESVSPVHGPHC